MDAFSPEDAKKYGGEPYEFSPAQNAVMSDLASSMKWVALPAFALASLTLMYLIIGIVWAVKTGAFREWHVIGSLLTLVAGLILYFVLARWLLTSSLGFRAIAETKGRDIGFLMLSLDNLAKMFGLLAFFVKVFLIVSLIGLVLSVVGAYRSDGWGQFKLPGVTVNTSAPVGGN